ncbi:MAG TPA: hypothetical protein VIX42_00575, partial [Edaphobacter sp.]
NQRQRYAEEQQTERLKRIERLHEKSFAIRKKCPIRTLRDFSRKANRSPAKAASARFQVQSLANHQERRRRMKRVETMGVVGGRA